MSLAVSLGAVVVVVLFANATTASRIAGNAEELHWSNATLGTAALARAAAGQLALFEELTESGFADLDALATASDELEAAVHALDALTINAEEPVRGSLIGFIASLRQRPVDVDEVDALYRRAAPALQEEISHSEEEIAMSQGVADLAYGAVRLVVILIVPAIVIFAYRRRAGRQLREAQIQMNVQLEAEREISQAKDQFVAGMSHEIRTPLTGIKGFSEMLLEQPAESPVDRDYVRVIYSEASELTRLVDDFIVASRIDAGDLAVRLEPVDIYLLSDAVAETFRRKGIRIRVLGEPATALCDPGRTRQVLTNLIANGVQHGGPHVSVLIEPGEDTVRAHVADDGYGVPPEIEERLFTRFVNDGEAALTAGSLGLGTWVARELARSMDGEVDYRRNGDLTSFRLELPATVLHTDAPDLAAASRLET